MASSGVRAKRSNLSAVLQKLHGSGFSSLPCKDDQDAVGSNLDSIFSTTTARVAEQSKFDINGINKTPESPLQATSITNGIDDHLSIKDDHLPKIKSDCTSIVENDTTVKNDHTFVKINHLLGKDGHILTDDGFTVVVKSSLTEIMEDFTVVNDNLTVVKEDITLIKDDQTSNEDDHLCVKEDILTVNDHESTVENEAVKSLLSSNSVVEIAGKGETGSISAYVPTETDVRLESNTYPINENGDDGMLIRLTPPEVTASSESSEVKPDRDYENDERNEVDDDDAKQIKNSRKKSRRKQQKTHRVLLTEDSILSSPVREKRTDVAPNLVSNTITGSGSKSETETNPILGNPEAMTDLDLPEGTVFVEPESVDTSPKFFSIESSRPKRIFKGGNLESAILHCTACNKQLGVEGLMDYHRHPMLKVLICRKCYNWYTSGEIEQDVDGSDEQCRWCRQGGDLICCDYCHNSFCKSCIRRNLGRKELSSILEAGDTSKWKCYVCDPKGLLALIEHCSGVMEALAKQEKKQQELELRRKRTARPCSSTVSAQTVSGTATPSEASAPAASVLRQHTSSLHSGQQSSAAVYSRVLQAKGSSNFANSGSLTSAGTGFKPGTSRTTTAMLANQSRTTTAATANQNRQVTVTGNRSGAPSVTVASPPSSNSPLNIVRYKNVCYKDQLSMVEKLISVTASMQMFLNSLSEDFNRTKVIRLSRTEPSASTPASASSTSAATSSPAAFAEAVSSTASSLVSLLTTQTGTTPSFAGGASGSSRSLILREARTMSSSEVSVKRNCIASKLVRASNSFLDSFKTIAQLDSTAKTATGFPYHGTASGSNFSSIAPGRAVTIRTTAGNTSTSTRVILPKNHVAPTSTSTASKKVTGILLTSKPSGSKLQMVTSPSGLPSVPSASLSPVGRSLPIVVRRVSHPTASGKTQNRSSPVTPNHISKTDDASALEEVLVISDSEDEVEKTATVVLPEIIIHDIVVDGKGNLVASGQPSGVGGASVLTKNSSAGNLVLAIKNSNSTSEIATSSGSKGDEGTRTATSLLRSKRRNDAEECASATSVVPKKVKVDDNTANQENLKVTSNLETIKRQNYLLEDSKNKLIDAKTTQGPLTKTLSSCKNLDSERLPNRDNTDVLEEDSERREEVKVPKKRGRKRKIEVEASDSQPASSEAAGEVEENESKKSLLESPGLLRRSNRRVSLPPQTQLPSPKKATQSNSNDSVSSNKAIKTDDIASGSDKTLKKTNVVSVELNKRGRKSLPVSSSLAVTNSKSSTFAKSSPKSSEDKNGIATRLRRSASRLASIANGTV